MGGGSRQGRRGVTELGPLGLDGTVAVLPSWAVSAPVGIATAARARGRDETSMEPLGTGRVAVVMGGREPPSLSARQCSADEGGGRAIAVAAAFGGASSVQALFRAAASSSPRPLAHVAHSPATVGWTGGGRGLGLRNRQ